MALPIAVRFNSSVQVDKQFLIPSFDDHVYLFFFCKLQLLQPRSLLRSRASYFQPKHVSKSRPTQDRKDKTHRMKHGEHWKRQWWFCIMPNTSWYTWTKEQHHIPSMTWEKATKLDLVHNPIYPIEFFWNCRLNLAFFINLDHVLNIASYPYFHLICRCWVAICFQYIPDTF